MKAKRIAKIALTTALSIAIVLVILTGIILAGVVWVFTPEKLTELTQKYANEYIVDSHADVDRVELTIWRTFPHATLEVEGVTLYSHVLDTVAADRRALLPASTDTLLRAKKMRVSVNLLKLLTGSIDVHDAIVSGLQVNMVQYSEQLANYMILPASEEDNDTTSFEMPSITLNSVEITDCHAIRYFSLPDTIDCSIDIEAVQLSAQYDGLLQLVASTYVNATVGGTKMLNNLPITTNTYIDWNANDMMKVAITPSTLHIGNIPITYNLAANFNAPATIESFTTQIGSFEPMKQLQYLAPEYQSMLDGVETDLSATLGINLTQPFNMERDSIPCVDINLDIPSFYLQGPKRRRIDSIALSGNASINGDVIDSSRVNIKNFLMKGNSIELSGNGSLSTPISDPYITCALKGKANIGNLIETFGVELGYDISGIFNADTRMQMHLNDMLNGYYNKLGITGNMRLRNFSVTSETDTLALYAHNTTLDFNSNKKYDKGDGSRPVHLLAGSLNIDSLNLDYVGERVTIVDSKMSAAASPRATTLDGKHPFIPFGVRINSRSARYRMIDSSFVALHEFIGKASVTKPQIKATRPQVGLNINAQRVAYLSKTLRAALRQPEIDLLLTPQERKARRDTSMHRNHRMLPPDSMKMMANKVEVLDLSVDSTTRSMLRDWQLVGAVTTDKARVFTPYFPIANSLSNLNMTFSLDSVLVHSAEIRSGRSDMNVTGGIYNIRSALIGRNRRQPLTIKFDLDADTLDINQLLSTTYAAMSYMENQDAALAASMMSDSNDGSDDAQIQAKIEASADTVVSAITIPVNIESDIDIHAKHGYYADMKLSNLDGCMLMHDGVLKLHDLKTNSDAGDLLFNAFYTGRNRNEIKTAFNLEMNDIRIDRFINLIPAVDTIMPLLKAMEGIIDAKIAASTEVDSAMNVKFPTLSAAVKLHGDSLVLFDSETFASISKMLLFKNKKRNMIDNMDVEFIVKDNTMEIFPFTFEIDRYRVGVMGQNDLDMNLKYHISVLKSPIPFKFGLNISGTPEKMKYRLGKAKYKDSSASEVHQIVENAQLNLKEEIENAFRRGAEVARKTEMRIDQSELAKLRQETVAVDTLSTNDSLQMIQQGLIEAPVVPQDQKKKKKGKTK